MDEKKSLGAAARYGRLEAALARLDPEDDALRASRVLRAALGPERAREALALRELRRRATGRFPAAERALLTAVGLQQASHPAAAAHRARTLAERAGPGLVLDATCGLGADAIALAAEGLDVVAADRDPGNAFRAHWNARAAGMPLPALAADVLAPAVTAPWLVVDPDRRPQGRRELDPERGSPPLSALGRRLAEVRGAAVKLAPALDVARAEALLPPELRIGWQWVSAGGELRETVLWTGELAPEHPREAVALRPGGPARFGGEPTDVEPWDAERAAGAAFVHEPDPALVRSGLLGALARELGLAPLGPRIAFLGGEEALEHPLLRSHAVLGSAPADPRRVRAMLGEHDVGLVAVKKRGHPESAETLAQRFRGRGARRGRVLVARLERGHRAYLVAVH